MSEQPCNRCGYVHEQTTAGCPVPTQNNRTQPFTCPVCSGKGKVPAGFYGAIGVEAWRAILERNELLAAKDAAERHVRVLHEAVERLLWATMDHDGQFVIPADSDGRFAPAENLRELATDLWAIPPQEET